MSDLSEDENYYQQEIFDNETKFEADSKKEILSGEIPDKSIDFYSTTYMSKKNETDRAHDMDEDEDNDAQDEDEENDDDVDEDDDSNESDQDDDTYYENSSIGGLTDSQSLSNDYPDMFTNNQAEKLQMTRNDETKMIHMRSFLNKVEKNFLEKDNITQNIRKEISECKQNIEILERKRDEVYNKLKNAQTTGNM